MLRFTAMQMRELLWNPATRDEFKAILDEFGDPELEEFIDNVTMLRLHVEYNEGVHCNGIIIPVFGSEAIFQSSFITESFIFFLGIIFERYDEKMGTSIKNKLIAEFDLDAAVGRGFSKMPDFEVKDDIMQVVESIYPKLEELSSYSSNLINNEEHKN